MAAQQELPDLLLEPPDLLLELQDSPLERPEQEAQAGQLGAHPQGQEVPADHFPAPSMGVAGRTGGRLLLLVSSLCCWVKLSAR